MSAADGLRVESLVFSIGTFRLAIDSLTVAPGEYFVLSGPNGSGKSVLLKLIAGMYRPDSGRIFIGERDVTDVPPWERNIGYVPQDGLLFPNRTVRANIEFGLEMRGARPVERRCRSDELLELLAIAPLAQRYPAGLSGGERQKVSLARAIAFSPSLLLLDEPVSAIDEATRDPLCAELKRMQRRFAITTVHISHNSHETQLVADRIGTIAVGRYSA